MGNGFDSPCFLSTMFDSLSISASSVCSRSHSIVTLRSKVERFNRITAHLRDSAVPRSPSIQHDIGVLLTDLMLPKDASAILGHKTLQLRSVVCPESRLSSVLNCMLHNLPANLKGLSRLQTAVMKVWCKGVLTFSHLTQSGEVPECRLCQVCPEHSDHILQCLSSRLIFHRLYSIDLSVPHAFLMVTMENM